MNNKSRRHTSWLDGAMGLCATAGELLVPQSCPGCGSPGQLCASCREELEVRPVRVSPRIPSTIPVWSCGPYSGARREIVIAAKERGNLAARQVMGAVIAGAINFLVGEGIVDHPLTTPIVLIPAPTKASSSRRRGGDPVAAACAFATEKLTRAVVVPVVETVEQAQDSSGLNARSRRSNISGRITPKKSFSRSHQGISVDEATVVLVDDVVTTGATTAESTMVLASLSIRTDLVLTFTWA